MLSGVPTVLLATGIMDSVDFKEDFPNVEFAVFSNIISAMEAMATNKSTYDYIIVTVNSFVITEGMDYDTVMQTLATVLKSINYQKFLVLDVDRTLEAFYNKHMLEVRNKAIYNVSKQIKFRNLIMAIKTILKNTDNKEIPLEPDPQPQALKPATKKLILPERHIKEKKLKKEKPVQELPNTESELNQSKKFFNFFEKKQKNIVQDHSVENTVQQVEPQLVDKKEKEVVEEQPILQQPIFSDAEPDTPPSGQFDILPPPVPEPDEQLYEVPEVTGLDQKFQNTSILCTSLGSKYGTTTTAMLIAKELAEQGLSTCYVQLTDEIFTANYYVNPLKYLEASVEIPLQEKLLNVKDVTDLVAVSENVHLIYNRDDDFFTCDFTSLARFINRVNKTFDTVVYDVSRGFLLQFPAITNLFTYRNLILTNSIESISETKRVMHILYESDEHILLFNDLMNSYNYIISKCSDSRTIDDKPIIPSETLEHIVDQDDDLCELEFRPIIGEIPFNSRIASVPLAHSGMQYIKELLIRMR